MFYCTQISTHCSYSARLSLDQLPISSLCCSTQPEAYELGFILPSGEMYWQKRQACPERVRLHAADNAAPLPPSRSKNVPNRRRMTTLCRSRRPGQDSEGLGAPADVPSTFCPFTNAPGSYLCCLLRLWHFQGALGSSAGGRGPRSSHRPLAAQVHTCSLSCLAVRLEAGQNVNHLSRRSNSGDASLHIDIWLPDGSTSSLQPSGRLLLDFSELVWAHRRYAVARGSGRAFYRMGDERPIHTSGQRRASHGSVHSKRRANSRKHRCAVSAFRSVSRASATR